MTDLLSLQPPRITAHHNNRLSDVRQDDAREAATRVPSRAHKAGDDGLGGALPEVPAAPDIGPNAVDLADGVRPIGGGGGARAVGQRGGEGRARRAVRGGQAGAVSPRYSGPRRPQLHQGVALPAVLRG